MEGIIAEIIDRLIAENARRVLAEKALEDMKREADALDKKVAELQQELNISTSTVSWSRQKREALEAECDKLKAELAALKGGAPDAGEV